MKFLNKRLEELKRIQQEIDKKGISVKEYDTSEYGFYQKYKVKIHTKTRTIDNIYIN
jgi:hypothetical protein